MELPQALFNLTSTNADVRRGSEELLKHMPDDALVSGLLLCLPFECPDSSTQTVVRSMAAVVLRRKLTGGTDVMFKRLSADVQRQVQAGLLTGLLRQQQVGVGRKVCDAVVDLAVVLHQEGRWEELLGCVGQLLAGPEPQPLFGHSILQQLLEMEPPKFSPPAALRDILQAGLQHPSLAVQVAAVKTYAAAVVHSDALPKDKAAELAPGVIRLLERCLNGPHQAEAEQILTSLVEVLEEKPQALITHSQQCMPTMAQVCRAAGVPENLRRLALDFIASTLEGNPAQGQPVVKDTLQLCMGLMLEIEEDPQWATQHTDYDTSEDALVEAGQVALARLAAVLPNNILLPALALALSDYALHPHWAHRHAALLAIVQTCEEMEDTHVRQLMPFVVASLKDPSPRVQWAAAQATSQLLSEHEEWLALEYHEELMPLLLDKMVTAPPRVVAWVCAALRDLCEHLSAEDLKPYLPELLGRCLTLLQNSPPCVLEKAFQTVSWVADAIEEGFRPFYPPYEAALFLAVERPAQDREAVRGRAMECLTSVGRAVGKDVFRSGAHRFLETTLALACGPKGFAPGWSAYYLLGAWRRITEALELEIVPFLPRLVPILLAVAGVEALQEGQWSADDEAEGVQWVTDAHGLRRCVNPTLLEGKAAACEVLAQLLEACTTECAPCLGPILEGMSALLAFPLDVKVRCHASRCLAQAVLCARDAPERAHLGSLVVTRLLDALPTEDDPEGLVDHLKAVRATMDAVGAPLPSPDPATLVARLLVPLQASAGRVAAAQARRDSGAYDEEDLETAKTWEEAAMLRLLRCFEAVLSTQGEAALPVVDAQLRQLWAGLTPEADQLRWMVTLGLLAEVLKVAPPAMFQSYFTTCVTQVKDSCGAGGFFTVLRTLEVRRAAYAALTQLAQRGGEAFTPHAAPTARMCTALLSSECDEEDDDQLRLRDMAAAALAAVLEHHRPHVCKVPETLTIWLSWLPAKADDSLADPLTLSLCRLIVAGALGADMGAVPLYTAALKVLGQLDPEDEEPGSEVKPAVCSVLDAAAHLPPEVGAAVFKGLSANTRKALERWRQ